MDSLKKRLWFNASGSHKGPRFFLNGDKHRNKVVQRKKLPTLTSLPRMKMTLSEQENALKETVEAFVMLRCNENKTEDRY